MKSISNSTKAIAWMMAKPGRTQTDASDMFGISQGAISSTKGREDRAILFCEDKRDLVRKASDILEENPEQTWRGVAYKLGISEAVARHIVLGLHAKTVRDAAAFAESGAHMGDVSEELNAGSQFGWEAGRSEMREQCAKMVELLGGEYGAPIALAVRSIPL